jgi:hypothetical protein
LVTQFQREANRKNALKSTGPKTAKGKAKAKMNALKHGLTAEEIAIPGEDGDKFDALLEMLRSHLEPVGPEEILLVERITACLWRLRRCYAVEAGIFAYEMARAENHAASEAVRMLQKHSRYSTMLSRMQLESDEMDEHAQAVERAERARQALDKASDSIGAAFLSDAGTTNALTKLSRYEATIERALYKARHELERLQAAQEGASVTPPVTIDITVDHENLPDPEGS